LISSSFPEPKSALIIDFYKDIDILTVSQNLDIIGCYENDGSQNFTKIIVDNNAIGVHNITFADFNLDGSTDIAGALFKRSAFVIYENIPKRKFNKINISNDKIGM